MPISLYYILTNTIHFAASKYLTMRECYRSVSHTMHDFNLNDLIDIEALASNGNNKTSQDIYAQDLSDKIGSILEPNLYLNLRDKVVRILPQHWVNRVVDIITFHAGQYKGSDIPKLCRLNGNKFNSLAEMAFYVCDNAFEAAEADETDRAARALGEIFKGKI